MRNDTKDLLYAAQQLQNADHRNRELATRHFLGTVTPSRLCFLIQNYEEACDTAMYFAVQVLKLEGKLDFGEFTGFDKIPDLPDPSAK